MEHAIAWFEIPVADLDRARRFYETIFAATFPTMRIGETGRSLALFPVDMSRGVGGALVCGPGYASAQEIPGGHGVQQGAKLYLNAGADLDVVLSRVAAAGGKVVVPKTPVSPEFGFMGAFLDTEGNWVGLHSVR